MISRRGLVAGLGVLVAAPAVAKAASLMKLRGLVMSADIVHYTDAGQLALGGNCYGHMMTYEWDEATEDYAARLKDFMQRIRDSVQV